MFVFDKNPGDGIHLWISIVGTVGSDLTRPDSTSCLMDGLSWRYSAIEPLDLLYHFSGISNLCGH